MNICDLQHEEVVFNGKQCPVCLLIEDIEAMELEMGVIEQELEDYKCN